MRVWTEEQKQKQRDAIRAWAPWKRSTGPRTPEGKAISAQNAYKHGLYSVAGKRLKNWLYHQSLYVRQVQFLLKNLEHRKNQNPSNELLKNLLKEGMILKQVSPVDILMAMGSPPSRRVQDRFRIV